MGSEISVHEARLFSVLSANEERWMTTRELATEADVAVRTVRVHLKRLARLGIVEEAKVFPGFRYRMKKDRWSVEHHRSLLEACAVFGLIISHR